MTEVKILPLEGKYYGTEIAVGDNIISIWGVNKVGKPSSREYARCDDIEDDRDIMCDCHYEDVGDYIVAIVIERALKEHFKDA